MIKMEFIKSYIKSMRPYAFFVTGIAGLIGMHLVDTSLSLFWQIIVLIILFSSYGVNQVINDLLGTKEDKINAPKRPSISGELEFRKAIITSIVIFILGGLLTYFLNPYALVLYLLGYIANIIYEYLKGVPFIGNLWFGFMISLLPLYGAMVSSGLTLIQVLRNSDLMFISLLVLLSASTLCYFTYFKDSYGDKKANKITAAVLLSPGYARLLGFVNVLIPYVLLFFFLFSNLISFKINMLFLLMITVTLILSLYGASLYFGKKYDKKKALELSFESTVLFYVSILSLINKYLALVLYFASFLLIKLIYSRMYKKELY